MKQFLYNVTFVAIIGLLVSQLDSKAMDTLPLIDEPLGPIHILATEHELHICSFIESSSDLSSMSVVSTHWNDVLTTLYNDSKNTFVMGHLGSGVSTLALLLAGKELTVEKGDFTCLFECSDKTTDINIAHGFRTGTLQHTYIVSENRGKIWDCSSFDKERVKPEVDFLKAQNLKQSIHGLVQVIIAIQEPYQLYGWNAMDSVMEVLNRVSEMFSDLDQLKKLVTLVVTKCSGLPVLSCPNILNACLDIEENYPGRYTHNFRPLVTHFLENSSKVISFQKPTRFGPYVMSEQLRNLVNNSAFILNPIVTSPTLGGIQEGNWSETLRERSAAIN